MCLRVGEGWIWRRCRRSSSSITKIGDSEYEILGFVFFASERYELWSKVEFFYDASCELHTALCMFIKNCCDYISRMREICGDSLCIR